MRRISSVFAIIIVIAISIILNKILNEAQITGQVATNVSGAVVNITLFPAGPTNITVFQGRGAGSTRKADLDFIIIPDPVYIKTKEKNVTKQLIIRNMGDLTFEFLISSNLNLDISENKFKVSPGDEKSFYVAYKFDRPGIYTGLIEVTNGFIKKYVPVIIELSSDADFNVGLYLPEEYKKIKPGSELLLKVDLSNIYGVTDVDYVVKDSNNKFVLKEHEVISINEKYSFDKTIKLPRLKIGTYVVGIIVTNNRKTVVISELFKVVNIKELSLEEPKEIETGGNYFLIFLIISLLVTAIIYYAKKKS